ncbi:MAG: glutamate--cysteine ligase [Gammaproteobacteria bacterium]|nr:glutamate--cysteine ligase [Gammaproteobacteria bacterium]MCY4339597.1 glutamate--cysteine ligase [Gammaproteobacteria bacterium]
MVAAAAEIVPHLTTALSGPLNIIESVILEHQARIESWFRSQWRKTPAPLYASVDLRNAGHKIAPVDTNLFPAGFNNLNPAFESLCIQAVQSALGRLAQPVDRVLIIPENHTRNMHYLESLAVLQGIFVKAGFETRVGSLLPDLDQPMHISLNSGAPLCLEPLQRDGASLFVQDFQPELLVLNNDLSSGVPELLKGSEQLIMPPLNLGWSDRLKSVHFGFYRDTAQEFAALLDIDPWLIEPLFRNCGEVDFMKRAGESCLSRNVEALLTAIRKKYDEYDINSDPFVMIKADSGTYGMGVMSVHSPEEVHDLNRKQRTKMATVKEGQKVTKAIIQEGVYTHETWGKPNTVAEPVVYLIGQNVVGGFYRVHPQRATNENLNSPGMYFERLAFEECCNSPDREQSPAAHLNRFYSYGVLARLAALAAAREVQSLG